MLEPAEFTQRLRAYLVDAGHLDDAAVTAPAFGALAGLDQTRIQVLGDAWGLIKFFYVDDDEFVVDAGIGAKNLGADASPMLDAAITALTGCRRGTPRRSRRPSSLHWSRDWSSSRAKRRSALFASRSPGPR